MVVNFQYEKLINLQRNLAYKMLQLINLSYPP